MTHQERLVPCGGERLLENVSSHRVCVRSSLLCIETIHNKYSRTSAHTVNRIVLISALHSEIRTRDRYRPSQ